jgi:hypothetical protein
MLTKQMAKFALGLANTGYAFLWNVRPDLVKGSSGGAGLPAGFAAATEGWSMLST